MRLAFIVLAIAGSAGAVDLRYWIEPCTRPETHCAAYDPQMAEWALMDWQRSSDGKLHLEKAPTREKANIRVHWAAPEGVYGETVAFDDGTIKGFDVYVLVDLTGAGPEIAPAVARDPLLRDAIVFLTCLHETGHALRLAHTDVYTDIMYTFYYGGDIPEYFGRYRRRITKRDDIQHTSAISDKDHAQLLKALASN